LSLTSAPDPVESVATQIGVSGTGAVSGDDVTLHLKPSGGTACGANPSADDGAEVIYRANINGSYSESRNQTFDAAGTYVLCAWTEHSGSAAVTASATATVTVRIPHLALGIAAPDSAAADATFQVTTTAQAEAGRTVYLGAVPDTGRGCSANYAALDDSSGFKEIRYAWSVTGGPLTDTQNVSFSEPGPYLLCAYFEYGGTGTPPEAVASRPLTILAPCVVPNLVGIGRQKAEGLIAAAHCTLGKVTKTKSKKYKKGKVVRTNRKPGTELASGAAVGIVVSSGHPKKKKKRKH
jgi:hypothetical protein